MKFTTILIISMSKEFVKQSSSDLALTGLGNASDKTKFFSWIYSPQDFLTTNEVLKMKEEYDISSNVILRKIIINLLHKQLSDEEIINYLKEEQVLTICNENKLNDIITECKNISIHELKLSDVEHITKLSSKFSHSSLHKDKKKMQDKTKHMELPHPDAELGRPLLEWKECYHFDCHKKFDSANALKEHLTELDALKHNVHKFHADYVMMNNLTPEKVMNGNYTTCPAWVCHEYNIKMTPAEVCNHFRAHGIFPFWQPGDICEDLLKYDNNSSEKIALNYASYNKTYEVDQCAICFETPPDIIFLPCMHHLSCFKCSSNLNKCPLCKTNIKQSLPF